MDKNEINALVKRAKHGDTKAFGRLYEEHALALYRFSLYVLKNSQDAEDAVQNACITAYRKIGDLRKNDSFRSWFFKILFNECRKMTVSRVRQYEVPCEDVSVYDEPSSDNTRNIDMLSLLDSLSPTEKSIVVLSVFEGYSSEEIGEMVGMKAGSVRSSLSRLLKKLRKQLEGADNE